MTDSASLVKSPSIEIIIRCFNEEDWVSICLAEIENQSLKPSIVTVVDNCSTDSSLQRINYWISITPINSRVVSYRNPNGIYSPGHCLNTFVKNSNADIVVFLSAHCVPANRDWLTWLIKPLIENSTLAATYGRQIPTSKSDPRDARDLFWTFGSDPIISSTDPFFHNANSAIRRKILEKLPFDEQLTNIEDRVWASRLLAETAYRIAYEPNSIVYHEHGIHQAGKIERATSIVSIAKSIIEIPNVCEPNTRLYCIIPVSPSREGATWIEYTIKAIRTALKADVLSDKIIISIDGLIEIPATLKNMKVLVVRRFEEDQISMQDILLKTLDLVKEYHVFPEDILLLEPGFVGRTAASIEKLISSYYTSPFPVAMFRLPLRLHTWRQEKNQLVRIDSYELARSSHTEVILGVRGLGTIIRISQLRLQFWLDSDVCFVNPATQAECIPIEPSSELN